ncbi:phosphoserine phosphatase SerB [Citricoccus muralis]|uniref:phosphoserine phosphatase n=1 Tax=Citricoccus muralis TaxID=169134 RepID=A0ABY8H3P4_9MICC|nr:phosphoserine phosphatase SerB [Citricoccus muralis]WFP15318.1 phosphoserine phosphatase SerB [Citricoccus muralis]
MAQDRPYESPRAETQSPLSAGTMLVYRAATPATSPDAVAPSGVPQAAEIVSGVGFTGWRWDAEEALSLAANETKDGWNAAFLPATVRTAITEHAPLLVFDVDSTLIRQEVIELLAAHAGREAEVAAVTEAAMRGELDFAQSLHHRVEALAGLSVEVIDAVVDRVVFNEGALELVSAVRAAGGAACAVSGGFEQVLEPLAAQAGLWRYRANVLEIDGGVLTGRVSRDVVDRQAKRESLKQWAKERGVPLEAVVALGDGANDIDMLDTAGFAVAFCAKPALREHADLCLDVPSLDVVRALLGLSLNHPG